MAFFFILQYFCSYIVYIPQRQNVYNTMYIYETKFTTARTSLYNYFIQRMFVLLEQTSTSAYIHSGKYRILRAAPNKCTALHKYFVVFRKIEAHDTDYLIDITERVYCARAWHVQFKRKRKRHATDLLAVIISCLRKHWTVYMHFLLGDYFSHLCATKVTMLRYIKINKF